MCKKPEIKNKNIYYLKIYGSFEKCLDWLVIWSLLSVSAIFQQIHDHQIYWGRKSWTATWITNWQMMEHLSKVRIILSFRGLWRMCFGLGSTEETLTLLIPLVNFEVVSTVHGAMSWWFNNLCNCRQYEGIVREW